MMLWNHPQHLYAIKDWQKHGEVWACESTTASKIWYNLNLNMLTRLQYVIRNTHPQQLLPHHPPYWLKNKSQSTWFTRFDSLWLFPKIKTALKEHRFFDVSDVQKHLTRKLKINPENEFKKCYEQGSSLKEITVMKEYTSTLQSFGSCIIWLRSVYQTNISFCSIIGK